MMRRLRCWLRGHLFTYSQRWINRSGRQEEVCRRCHATRSVR